MFFRKKNKDQVLPQRLIYQISFKKTLRVHYEQYAGLEPMATIEGAGMLREYEGSSVFVVVLSSGEINLIDKQNVSGIVIDEGGF